MNKQFKARHGDVLILQKDKIKKEGKTEKPILAYGEVTGHMHQIVEGLAHVYKFDNKIYMEALTDCKINHEEHGLKEIPKGDYEIIIQEEWQETGWKKVID
jgi:hypothetical protein